LDAFRYTNLAERDEDEVLNVIKPLSCRKALIIAPQIRNIRLSLDVISRLNGFVKNVFEILAFNSPPVGRLLEARS